MVLYVCYLNFNQRLNYTFFNNLATSSLLFNPAGSCDISEAATPYLWAQDSAVQGYSHRTSYYKTFWSSFEEAKMWSKWWNGEKWTENDANLDLSISATRLGATCTFASSESQPQDCFCDVKRVRVNTGIFGQQKWVRHCDGDVIGTYKKTLNWQGTTWSIDATGDIDFACCE